MSEAQDDTITAPRDGSAVLPSPPQPPPVVRSGDPSADERVRLACSRPAGASVGLKAAQALGLSEPLRQRYRDHEEARHLLIG